MPLVKQPAYISPSTITATIGGTFTSQLPFTPIVPAYNLQDGNTTIATGRGLWVQSFDYYGSNSSGATSFLFPDVEGSYSFFMQSVPTSITSFSAPNLLYVGGAILGSSPAILSSLTSVSLPKLAYASTMFANATLSGLTSLDLSSLISVGQFNPSSMNGISSLSFPQLKITSLLAIVSSSCTSISLPSIISVSGLSISASSCTTLTLPTLGTWKICVPSLAITSCAFNQASVDSLLSAIAYMDGTNSTLLYGTGKTLTITGTSSAPTNLGSTTTAGSNFVGAGTTCTVNMTAHGYATDDVLRISGITTLTNANRYARITVVNANQFTYTITSQTATGAGTATVIKAGASAKAIVTRGVTLATN